MSDTSDGPKTARGVHLACYVLLAGLFVYAAVERYRRPLVFQDQAPVEPERSAQIQTRVDPNTAGWPELARLPHVGESLARAIVAYREESRGKGGKPTSAPATVFRSIADLNPIPGIGEKTLQRIEPYLLFP